MVVVPATQSRRGERAPASGAERRRESGPKGLSLRAMNMLFEGLKEKGDLVIVPSSAVETMNLGSLMGMVSLAGSLQAQMGGEPSATAPLEE